MISSRSLIGLDLDPMQEELDAIPPPERAEVWAKARALAKGTHAATEVTQESMRQALDEHAAKGVR